MKILYVFLKHEHINTIKPRKKPVNHPFSSMDLGVFSHRNSKFEVTQKPLATSVFCWASCDWDIVNAEVHPGGQEPGHHSPPAQTLQPVTFSHRTDQLEVCRGTV